MTNTLSLVREHSGSTPGSISGMKISVSLPEDDVQFLDAHASAHEFPSRSAVVHEAIRALRLGELNEAYGEAWSEWEASEDSDIWEASAGDGL